ncbi:MAG: hypothetical protein EBS87_07965 [Sphingomonadaceae bacterium]|jgi:hypothetical protein|nr:hypothetical protein [Sphingomonadaceae bacterium]NCA02108.1 hypothetical protein [Sphingomonadaceae bacterium]
MPFCGTVRKGLRKEKAHVVVAICSHGGGRERREAVRRTWLSRQVKGVSYFFFVGRGADIAGEKDVVVLDVDDGYGSLPLKVREALAYALKRYDADWLFKCDDDTYVVLDRLSSVPRPRYDLIGDESVDARGAPSGGAGYFLSTALAAKICADRTLPAVGAEDLVIGRAAAAKGARLASSTLLCKDRAFLPSAGNRQVTCHWCEPLALGVVHDLMMQGEGHVIRAVHRVWRDDVFLLKSGYFARKNGGAMGRWTEVSPGMLQMDWFDWDREFFIRSGEAYIGPVDQGADKTQPAASRPVKIPHLPSHYRHTLIISLANSGRKARALARAEEFSHEVVWSPGVLADPDKITWNDVNGMEAYFSANNFRNRYIPAAIGCRLAGLAAFERGIELAESIPGGVRGFMVCEDDFMLKNPQLFLQCFKDLPDDADALWLDTSSLRAPTYDLPGTCLRRIMGARVCTAFWLSVSHAKEIVPLLRCSNCEWDLFMEQQMPRGLYYGPRTPVFRQSGELSELNWPLRLDA